LSVPSSPRREQSMGLLGTEFALAQGRPSGGSAAEAQDGWRAARALHHGCSENFWNRARSAAKGAAMRGWACAEGRLASKRARWSRLGRRLCSTRAWGPVLAPFATARKSRNTFGRRCRIETRRMVVLCRALRAWAAGMRACAHVSPAPTAFHPSERISPDLSPRGRHANTPRLRWTASACSRLALVKDAFPRGGRMQVVMRQSARCGVQIGEIISSAGTR
jgi:hypothetical protein